jgi:UDPglucose 6-dehydrogenase
MNIAFVGSGYVGLVSGSCLAHLGHHVDFYDRDEILVEKLRRSITPIHEDGLERLLEQNRTAGRTQFHAGFNSSVANAEIVFLCVGTPPHEDTGEADLSMLYAAVRDLALHLVDGTTLVLKSTVPVGTNEAITKLIRKLRPDISVPVASNPEFLREGTAVDDFLNAERIVVGVNDEASRDRMVSVYAPWQNMRTRLVITTPQNAELSKYAANAFLAVKITFINEIADLCEMVGGNIGDVATMIGMDQRIGSKFLQAGPGYGGSCFPKDTLALSATARKAGRPVSLVEATIQANNDRKLALADRIVATLVTLERAPRVAVLGITFKAGTDDVRDAPGVEIIRRLQRAGVEISIHDPVGRENGMRIVTGVSWHDDPLDAAHEADAVVVMTEWPQFREIDLLALSARMTGDRVFDLRNLFDAGAVRAAGLTYYGVGGGAEGGTLEMIQLPINTQSLREAL